MKKRGFEIVNDYQTKVNLPKRATKHAAGYDFEAAEEIVIPSIWKKGIATVLKAALKGEVLTSTDEAIKPTLVPTGIKAYMAEDEYLQLCNRSSNPLKHLLFLANGVGVIDSDYYNNPNNEGHIYFQFLNFGLKDKKIAKGERIGQGIFLPFLKADQDTEGQERSGGFGSSGR